MEKNSKKSDFLEDLIFVEESLCERHIKMVKYCENNSFDLYQRKDSYFLFRNSLFNAKPKFIGNEIITKKNINSRI